MRKKSISLKAISLLDKEIVELLSAELSRDYLKTTILYSKLLGAVDDLYDVLVKKEKLVLDVIKGIDSWKWRKDIRRKLIDNLLKEFKSSENKKIYE